MRNTDPDPAPFQPLGPKVEKPKPAGDEWKTIDEKRHIQQDKDGRLRTNIPAEERPRLYLDMPMIRADKQ